MADTPTRRAALLRLLKDWEAGRMTLSGILPQRVDWELSRKGLIAESLYKRRYRCTLTPAGLAAARAIKEAQTHE